MNVVRVWLVVTGLIVAGLVVGWVIRLVVSVVDVGLAIIIVGILVIHGLSIVQDWASIAHQCIINDHGGSEEVNSPSSTHTSKQEEEDEEYEDTDGPIDPRVVVVEVLTVSLVIIKLPYTLVQL